jgi:DNA modification methylase
MNSHGYELHHGDCLEVMRGMPDKSVDAIITDPPYGKEAHAAGAVCRGGSSEIRETLNFGSLSGIVMSRCIERYASTCRGWVLCFCQCEGIDQYNRRCAKIGLRYVRGGIWLKPDGAPQFTGDRPGNGFESIAIMWAGGKKMSWNGGGKHAIWKYSKGTANSKEHPTQKPLPLMKRLICDFTQPGDTVLDPFMGSGTTGVACMETGRKFIGIELDAGYYDIAAKRIHEATRQQRLF